MSPAWQRSGLGRAMIERLTNQLVQDGISTITLYAEPQVRPWVSRAAQPQLGAAGTISCQHCAAGAGIMHLTLLTRLRTQEHPCVLVSSTPLSALLLLSGWPLLVTLLVQVVGLYKKLGFVDDPQGIRGMAFQRKKKEKRLF